MDRRGFLSSLILCLLRQGRIRHYFQGTFVPFKRYSAGDDNSFEKGTRREVKPIPVRNLIRGSHHA